MWIWCEGDTERLYLDQMRINERISRLEIKPKRSGKKDAVGIIEEAVSFRKKNPNLFQDGDIVVCVFDRDANIDSSLKKAEAFAQGSDIRLIFSNPCYEVWLLFHFKTLNHPLESEEIIHTLDQYIPGYRKGDRGIYQRTVNRIDEAIINSDSSLERLVEAEIPLLCRDSNPTTNFNKLILLIRSFI